MLLRRSKRNPPPKRGGLFFTGRFQKVCQFRLRMYRLFELFRRLPSAIHFYLETIIFPNFMRFQEQKPGILKSVYEVNKNSIGEILAEKNILIYIYIVCACFSCLERLEISFLPIFNMSWMIFWIPFGSWPELFEPNSAEVFCFWSRNGWFDSFQAKAGSSPWQDHLFFSVERTFGCIIFATKRVNTTLQRSSD